MALIRHIPLAPQIDVMRHWRLFIALSCLIVVVSIGAVATFGLNFGVDFRGGTLIEVKTKEPVDLAD